MTARTRSRRGSTSTTDRATAYAKAVRAGRIVAGPHVRAACQRHLDDMKHGAARGIVFDTAAAARGIGFFEDVLRLAGGKFEGRRFDLLGWQAFVVGALTGWKRAATGLRRFQTAYVETAKGSGKSPLGAGMGLYMLTADGEARPECYAAAAKKDQAKVAFRDAVAMVQLSHDLAARCLLSGGAEKNNIAYVAKGGFFRPIASEDRGIGQSGPRPHFALLDEIHEHPTSAMVEFMIAGLKQRTQPLVFMITNSGSDPRSVCGTYHDYGAKVCAGTIPDDSFFAYICGLDEGDEPFEDEACWIKANPSLPATPGTEYLRRQVASARGMPSKRNLVRRLNFCEWTEADSAWIDRPAWEKLLDTFETDTLKGRRCWGGLDLSGKRDLTAFVVVWEPSGADPYWRAAAWLWTPDETIKEREERDRAPYALWRDEGHLIATDGKTIDYGFVAATIAEVFETHDLQSIAFDEYRIDSLRPELDEAGCPVDLVPHPQGFRRSRQSVDEAGRPRKDKARADDDSPGLWMPGSIDGLEALIDQDRLRIRRNPVLTWNAASAVIRESEEGNKKFNKRKATGKIDGVVALAMAVGLATLAINAKPAAPPTPQVFVI